MVATQDLYKVGEMPPIGEVPKQMHASLIRPERFGEPQRAFKVETIDVPELKPDEALVYVMAAGVNYNNVWAALGSPVDVVKVHERDGDPSGFHIGGSDLSGVVFALGSEVSNVKVGDHVLIGKYAGTEIKLDGEEYLIIREDEILGVAEGVPELATV